MAANWHDVLADKAELLLGRLEEGVWAGLGLLRTGLGIDLGLEPWLRRQSPGSASWLLLLAAAAGGLLLLLAGLWTAACRLGRCLGFGKRSGSGAPLVGTGGRRSGSGARNRDRTPAEVQLQRAEEQRKRSRKKEKPKKSQPNGRAGAEPLEEEINESFEKIIVKQLDVEKKTEKARKNKKKPKPEVKLLQDELQNRAECRETDEGAWETKISSREKRQQRRRDKGISDPPSSMDSSLPAGGSEGSSTQQHPQASSGLGPRKAKAVEASVAPGWGEQQAVNGGGWCDIPAKLPAQINATKEDKWQQIPVLSNAKRSPDQPAWGQERGDTSAGAKEWTVPIVDETWSEHALFPSIGAWTGVNERMNSSEPKPSFSRGAKASVASNTSEPSPQPSTTDHQWDANPTPSSIDDAWSGINGISTADPSSDWNAPTEEWGNWPAEEPAPAVQPEETVTEAQKVSDEDKEKTDAGLQGSASSKSKKKKKKKKKGEDTAAAAQEVEDQEKEPTCGDQEQLVVKAQPEEESSSPVETICTSELAEDEEALPVIISQEPAIILKSSSQDITSQVPDILSESEPSASVAKQNSQPSSQAKSEGSWESPKQIKKKKRARRET